MIEPAEHLDYTASIVSTDDAMHPFAVVVSSHDGEEVARKRVSTVEEAELFLELLYAALELRALQAEGIKPH
jgi:hypothetical protein